MLHDTIAEVRHNRPIRYLAVIFTLVLNSLFAYAMLDAMLGSAVITSDPNATAIDEVLVVLASATMLLVVPWLGLTQILRFRVRLTFEGILKTAPLTGRVFIRFEEIQYVRHSYWLEWFVIRGNGRRIFISPHVANFDPFVEALWKIAADRDLPQAARGGILTKKYAGAMGMSILPGMVESAENSVKKAIQTGAIREEDLLRAKKQLDEVSRTRKTGWDTRMLSAAIVFAIFAGILSAWPWLDMLTDPEYESLYYKNLTLEGWLAFAALLICASMGFVAVKMIVDKRFWASIITASMACIGIGAILGIPAVVLIILSRRHFQKEDLCGVELADADGIRSAARLARGLFWTAEGADRVRRVRVELRSAFSRYGVQLPVIQGPAEEYDRELGLLKIDIYACVQELRKVEAESPEMKDEISVIVEKLLQHCESIKTPR